jgi:hypothetical protein
MPSIRFGSVHLFNNYCNSPGNKEVNTPWYVNPNPGSDGSQSFLIPGNDPVFTPPYPYELEDPESARSAIAAHAGPRG